VGTTTIPRWVYADAVINSIHSDRQTTSSSGLTRQQWRVLVAVQSHLLPSGKNSPGAQDVQAAIYLHNILQSPDFDPDDRVFVKTGIIKIQKLTSQYKKEFTSISPAQREKVLRQFEHTRQGSLWLNMILEYLMEALLTDPIYGGNPAGIGWKWLGHTPGAPRPPKHKRYYLL
jgi:gluconate 2-dehydrogenase gamma chain